MLYSHLISSGIRHYLVPISTSTYGGIFLSNPLMMKIIQLIKSEVKRVWRKVNAFVKMTKIKSFTK